MAERAELELFAWDADIPGISPAGFRGLTRQRRRPGNGRGVAASISSGCEVRRRVGAPGSGIYSGACGIVISGKLGELILVHVK